jgi:hypothetical protein
MRHQLRFWFVVISLGFAGSMSGAVTAMGQAAETSPDPQTSPAKSGGETISFEHHVRPLLKAYCLDCHGGEEELQGDLDLRLARLIRKGGESGAAIIPGRPDDSLLIQRVRDGEMPPGEKKMPAADIDKLKRWIAAGAPTLRPEPELIDKGIGITPEEREFWAFQPLSKPASHPDDASKSSWARSAIDWQIESIAKSAGAPLADDADRATLLRRASLDLTGLPPTAEELDEFVASDAPDAFEQRLDRMLASPRYGERWGRHWLDAAGYADSDGYTNTDSPRPYVYKYRDYVIRSLNSDLPVDQFILEQLAGDELVGETTTNFTPEQIRWLTATGFLRLAADGTGSGAPDQDLARNQVMADTLKIVSSSLLGLTVQCAQCHNHRYDPIPQADYYRLRAIFEPALDWKNWRAPQQRLVSLYTDADRAQAAQVESEAQRVQAEKNEKQAQYLAAALEKELLKFPEDRRPALRMAYQTPADKRTPEQTALLKENPSVNISPGTLYQYDAMAAEDLKKFDQRIAEIRAKKPVEDFVHALVESNPTPPTTFVFHRGDHRQPKNAVTPGDLTIAAPPGSRFDISLAASPLSAATSPATASPAAAGKSGRRSAFAKHLTQGNHPLFGRVLANRLWQHHFGRGFVGTAGDLGMLGERPTHPALLDWLALEWYERQWSWKSMHRLLMTSAVYRQSSRNDAAQGNDQDNRLWARASVRRLDAEQIRDRMLFATGELSQRMFGPAAPVKEDEVGQVVVAEGEPRRSIYLLARRSQPVALLTAFDAPVMETNCERRPTSTVATQSLMLMNGEFVLRQAESLAKRARLEADSFTPPTYSTETRQLADRVEALRRPPVWRYGYGEFTEATQRVARFEALSHWTGGQWQGGSSLPDAKIGWVLLNAHGGHPGQGEAFAAIRRWTAPRAGVASVKGTLAHPQSPGDGVRGRIVSSRVGKVGEWSVFQQQAETVVNEIPVEAGDAIDFVVDCRTAESSDSYSWPVTVTLKATAIGEAPAATLPFASEKEFSGPRPPAAWRTLVQAWRLAYGRSPNDLELTWALEHVATQAPILHAATGESVAAELQAIVNVCQALLTSNEFLYVD